MLKKSLIVIGLPVFNGEKTLKKTLDSIIKQTFTDFQVIISDNNSTDSTKKICQEYSEKNSKITYFKQNKNIGATNNFKFVLNIAESEYFVWLAADDYWEPTFLEKNISILKLNKKFVGSIGMINYYDRNKQKYQKKIKWITSKIKKYHSYDEYFNCKNYQDRVSFYLRLNAAENIYALFRTLILKKCIKKFWEKDSLGMDLKILLFIQKFGEINILNEILLHRSLKGMSSQYHKKGHFGAESDCELFGKIFPFMQFSLWIFKNFGPIIFLKNLDYILFINGSATKYLLKQIFQ